MIFVPAGTFWMGCNIAVDNQCAGDESPYHQVALGAFLLDKTEVTQSDFNACVSAEICSKPTCLWNPATTGSAPVVCVDWSMANSYCVWKSKRLPTEAEWEYAARGADGRKFPWGNVAASCSLAVYTVSGDVGCNTGATWPVCSKTAGNSPLGFCDMAGNVYEWVNDWYSATYYASTPATNPPGPTTGTNRSIRGGSFMNGAVDLRVSAREGSSATSIMQIIGFRCAKNP
jgi:iron(II)-dependent oxidoreductase